MKKITTSILCIILSVGIAFAQGIYFRAGAGYALPLASESIGEKHLEVQDQTGNNNIYTTTTEDVSASYGTGVNFSFSGGYMFSKHFGVDLNFQYQKSKTHEVSDIYLYSSDSFSGSETDIVKSNSKAFFITPSFVITAGAGSKMPYGKFGVIIGMPKIEYEESYYYDLDGTTTEERKWEDKKGTAFGFQGTVGMNWALGNTISLFTEVNFISLVYYAKESELTLATYNGVDYMDQLTTSQKKIEFTKKVDESAQPDPDKPRQVLRDGKPFSSVGLQIGVLYILGGRAVD